MALLGFGANLFLGYWHLWYMVALAMGGLALGYSEMASSRQLLYIAGGLFSLGMLLQIAKLDFGIPMAVRIYPSGSS